MELEEYQLHSMSTLNPYLKDMKFTKEQWEKVELLFYLTTFSKDVPSVVIHSLGDFLKAYLNESSTLPISYLNAIFKDEKKRHLLLQLLLSVQQQREPS